MALRRPSFPTFLLLCFQLLAALHTTSDAAVGSQMPQAMHCSTSGNYSSASAYAANLNQFLASLPEKTVSKNGSFFNGTVGVGAGTVYALAMCSADHSRYDCGDCLAAAASSSSNGLLNRCPGSTTVLAWFDSCLIRYSDTNFFGTAELGSLAIVVVGSVIGVIMLACLIAALVRYVLKLRSKHKRGHVREFTFQELASATRNFAEIQKLGEGTFGAVYKGIVTLQDNEGNKKEVYAAIKKNKHTTSVEAKAAFYKEIDIMSPLNHCNIIRLMGWCKERKNLLLVYELAEDLNLQDRLYGGGASVDAERFGVRASGSVLDWHKWYNILVGIASGLEYLHTKCEKSVLHRDIKPGNVMLDKNFNAKLCDFGLVTQVTHAITSRSTDVIIGTQAYMDPAYRRNGKIYKESDVYSFGVLLLEVVCGEEPILIDNAGKNSLIEKVRECEKRGAILEAADRHLRGEFGEEIKGALSIGALVCQRKPW